MIGSVIVAISVVIILLWVTYLYYSDRIKKMEDLSKTVATDDELASAKAYLPLWLQDLMKRFQFWMYYYKQRYGFKLSIDDYNLHISL